MTTEATPIASERDDSTRTARPGPPAAGAEARPQAFYRALVDSLPLTVMRKDLDGRFTFVNEGFCEAVGLRPDEILGKTDFDLYPPDLAIKYRSDDSRVLDSGERLETVETHLAPSGRVFVQIIKTPVHDDAGRIVGVQCVSLDAADRIAMEDELHREREWLNAMLEACPDSIYFKDEQSRFLRVSQSLARRLGIAAPAYAIGKTDADFFGAAHANTVLEDERRILEGLDPILVKTECQVRLDGEARWMMTTKMPLRDKADGIVGTFGLSRDVTELRRAQLDLEARTAELQRSVERYRMIVESTQAVPWEGDGDTYQLSYVSPHAARLFGCAADNMAAGGSMLDLVYPDDRPGVQAQLDEVSRACGDQHLAIDYRVCRPDGSLAHVRNVMSVRREPGDARAIVRGVIFDISDQKKLELELHQAQKLESIGRLAAGVAHEINTPVQFVSDSVHFVRDAMTDLAKLIGHYRHIHGAVTNGRIDVGAVAAVAEAEQAADLEYLLEQVPKALARSLDGLDRVATIVRSMKEFAHPDQREMASVDLNQAARSTLIIARNEYKYVADVETDWGVIPFVRCHGGDVNQALLNIIVNAAHAIGDRVQGTPERGLIRLRTYREGADVVIAVSDTGGGIPEAVRDRIFDPFFTTKGVGRGTGQGLAIARSVIVEKHGGDVSFETVMGQGTTFFLRLPIETAPRDGDAA